MTKFAFVIMPFGEGFDTVFHKIIKPPLEDKGYQVERADSLKDRTNILKKIMTGMLRADIIIADLTDNNANVFYELGICHAKCKNVIMITQSIEKVPFDLKQYVLDSYSRDIDDVEKFTARLRELLDDLEKDNIKFENPVTDFWKYDKSIALLDNPHSLAPGTATVSSAEDKDYEDGIIDLRIRLDNSAELIKNDLESFPEIFSRFTSKIQQHSKDMEIANRSKSTVMIHKAAIEASETLQDFAQDMRSRNTSLIPQVEEFNEAMLGMDRLTSERSADDYASAQQFKDTISTTLESMESLKRIVKHTRDMRLAKAYTKAADKVVNEIDVQIKAFKSMQDTLLDVFPEVY